ncbi:MAG: hypothetical protein HY791_14750 [Deltaproteobacteria bacterium]|nr:hypothetical protein [Deltaproteobacteria bacterium]
MSRRLARYHVHLFEWHCRTFHPFDRHLTDAELEYLDASFALADKEDERPTTGYRHFSYYSYSHRVRGREVNSTRFAYGTLSKPDLLWPKAHTVIEDRRIELRRALPGFETFGFYGLGWDFLEGHFKVYFRVEDVDALSPAYRELMIDPPPHRREGLVSATFVGTDLVERKVYFYPIEERESSERALRTVTMATSARGSISQLDVPGSEAWRNALNDEGRRIVDLYTSVGERLDTLALEGPDAFTLYFP